MRAGTARRVATVALAAVLVAQSVLTIGQQVLAGSIDDFFSLGENDNEFDGPLYAGHVEGSINDNGNISDLTVSRGRRSVTFPELDETFEEFVTRRADDIMEILFPGGLDGAAEGVPGGSARALEAFDRLLDLGPIELAGRNHTMAMFEYEHFRVDGQAGNAYKLTPGHDVRFDRWDIGFAVPLRYSELEDDIDTQAYTAGLDLHAKYHFYLYPEWQLIPMVGAGSNVFGIRSDVADGAGYIRYGGYAGLSTTWEYAPFVAGAGVLYSVSDTALPDALLPSELEPIAHALSSRPADQQVTLGAKAAYQLPLKLLASVGYRHVETVGSSSIDFSKKSLNQYIGSLMYFPNDHLGFEVGYKYLSGVSGLYSSAAFLQGALYF